MARENTGKSLITPIDRDFGTYVSQLCGEMTNREVYRLTGVTHTTVGDMKFGVVPSFRILERLADGLPISPRQRYELFRRAGYVMNEGTPLERMMEYLQSLQVRYGKTVEIHPAKGLANLTHEDVDAIIASSDARIQREGWAEVSPLDEQRVTNRTGGA